MQTTSMTKFPVFECQWAWLTIFALWKTMFLCAVSSVLGIEVNMGSSFRMYYVCDAALSVCITHNGVLSWCGSGAHPGSIRELVFSYSLQRTSFARSSSHAKTAQGLNQKWIYIAEMMETEQREYWNGKVKKTTAPKKNNEKWA